MPFSFVHPFMISLYAIAAVGFLCLVSTKATKIEFYPERTVRYCMEQARHIYAGKKSENPILQLNRYACALSLISSARTLAPRSILRITRIDPVELSTAIQQAAKPLLQRARIAKDEFKAAFA